MLITLPNAFGDAVTNMAIDASLLETMPSESIVFRHYGWTEPAITFGYSQHYEEVARQVPDGVALCRRMTGGGIVDHRNDWTYMLVIDRMATPANFSSSELYATIHTALSKALSAQALATILAPCPRKCSETRTEQRGPEQCFIQPVQNDVLGTDGRKIAGAAIKKIRQGLLIQGSVDRNALPEAIDFASLHGQFVERLVDTLSTQRQQPQDLRPVFQSEIIEREKEKFASVDWTKRR